jgi:L,D-transpeptidase ErfK/SrfK
MMSRAVCASRLRWLLCGPALIAAACSAATFPLPPSGTDLIGEVRVVLTREEETLLDIARRFDVGFSEITAANPDVDPWVPGAGIRVVIPAQFVLPPGPRSGIVLNLAQLRLFYFPPAKKGQPAEVVTHPVGIGTDYAQTPLGETRIVRKVPNPVWRPSQDIREEHAANGDWLPATVPPGPDNPLGKFAMYLGLSGGYLIHGANKPWGVGMRVSHGCIRMYPEDIEALYGTVAVGTVVRVLDQRYVVGWRGKVPYLQAFPQVRTLPQQEDEDLTPAIDAIKRGVPRGTLLDWVKAVGAASEKRAIPVPIAMGSPDLMDIVSGAAVVEP